MFSLAPLIGACQHRLTDYIELFSRLRYIVKTQSLGWNMNNVAARQTIYRLIYGGRSAVEEAMLQASQETMSNRKKLLIFSNRQICHKTITQRYLTSPSLLNNIGRGF